MQGRKGYKSTSSNAVRNYDKHDQLLLSLKFPLAAKRQLREMLRVAICLLTAWRLSDFQGRIQ